MKPEINVSIGDSAPVFTTKNQNEQIRSLSDFIGKNVVLYFYPKAMTPGCTTQACEIRDHQSDFTKRNAVVLGISPDAPARLQKFIDKQNLNFELLSDEDHSIADLFGVWGPKKFMGKVYDGIHRSTFIIDPEGKIRAIMHPVKTKTHHEDVLSLLDTL